MPVDGIFLVLNCNRVTEIPPQGCDLFESIYICRIHKVVADAQRNLTGEGKTIVVRIFRKVVMKSV